MYMLELTIMILITDLAVKDMEQEDLKYTLEAVVIFVDHDL